MSHRSEGSSKEHSRERMVTLPPIRDIFREQLTSPPPQTSPYLSRSFTSNNSVQTYSTREPRRPASAKGKVPSLSAGIPYNGGSSWIDSGSQRVATPSLRPSISHGATFPGTSSHRSTSEHSHSHGSSPAFIPGQSLSPRGHNSSTDRDRYTGASSGVRSAHDPSRSIAETSAAWTEHRRRDSIESLWSSHSGSSAASSQPTHAPAHSNGLQFQPLPHTQGASSNARPTNSAGIPRSAPVDYQSPFGVLIADIDPRTASSSDPQRAAIMRTLRASGVQGSFQINFDDPASNQSPPRYCCQYCGKGFARPSSLRIHNNSHTGEKPFQCPHPDCGRRFSVHSNMRRHYRVHGGDAPKGGETSGDEGTDK